MKEQIEYTNIEGILIETIRFDEEDEKLRARRFAGYCFMQIRKQTKMNKKEFAQWLNIPYRTMQDWERGVALVPDYVLQLVAYKVRSEKEKGNL